MARLFQWLVYYIVLAYNTPQCFVTLIHGCRPIPPPIKSRVYARHCRVQHIRPIVTRAYRALSTEFYFSTKVIQLMHNLCFKDELDEVASVWNSHRIRPSRSTTCVPFGVPNSMYLAPENFGSHDHLYGVDNADIASCIQNTAHDCNPCDPDVFELCCDVMRQQHLEFSMDTWDLMQLYISLRSEVQNLVH